MVLDVIGTPFLPAPPNYTTGIGPSVLRERHIRQASSSSLPNPERYSRTLYPLANYTVRVDDILLAQISYRPSTLQLRRAWTEPDDSISL